MFSLICVRINSWINNREAGDLRRYRAHYDVTVMVPTLKVVRCFVSLCQPHAWWRHQMKTILALLALCAGNSPVSGKFSALKTSNARLFSLICTWINGWVNDQDAGNLRRNRAPYEVTVMNKDSIKTSHWFLNAGKCPTQQRKKHSHEISSWCVQL